MTAQTQPANWPQPRTGSEGAALVWLDALAGGICTPEAFLSAMQDQFQGDREKGWGILSLLDQYYRRGKIKAEIFHALKSRLEGDVLRNDETMTASLRSSASTAASPTTAATTPTAARPTTAPATPTAAAT